MVEIETSLLLPTGERVDYWINLAGEAKGPYTLEQLRSMWGNGMLTADTSYYDPKHEWVPLRGLLEPSQAPTPPRLLANEAVKRTLLACSESSVIPPEHELRYLLPDGATAPMVNHRNPLVFMGRWDRLTYLAAIVGYTMGMVAVGATFKMAGYHASNLPGTFYLLALLWVYLMTCAAVKRMHDINWPVWGIIVLPAPFTWLFLALVGGNDGVNRYGPKP